MSKLLVIDDRLDNLVVVKAICRNLMPELQVVTALSGQEGIELAKEEQPDVILLDIIMPELDGYEVCRLLKSDSELSIIPIILLTAILTDSDARVKGLEIGADAFLNKPINENELIAQIKVMLRIKSAEDDLRQEKSDLEALVSERTATLQQSEQKYRLLIENVNDAIVMNQKGNFIYFNHQFCQMLGFSEDELKKKVVSDLMTGRGMEILNERTRLRESGVEIPDRYETSFIRKDGSEVEVEANVNIIEHLGQPATYAVISDITERKQAEDALRESEEKFRHAIIDSPVPIMIHDEDDNVLQISSGWTDYSGYTIEDIPTMLDWTSKAYGSASATSEKYIDELFEINKTVDNGEWQVVAKDGSIKTWDFKTTPLGINSQGRRLLHSLAFDITERTQAEAGTKISEEKFRALFEQVGNYCMIANPNTDDGVPIIVDANKAFRKALGYTKSEMVGMPVTYLFDEEGKKTAKERFTQVMTGAPFSIETQRVRKDGSTFDAAVHAQRIDIGDMPPLIFSTEFDISARIKTEAELSSKQELIETSTRLTQIGGWEIDLETNESSFTRETYSIYGLDANAPKPSMEESINFFAPEARLIIQDLVDVAINQHKSYDVVLPFINARGEARWVRSVGEVEVQEGKAVRLYGAIQDVTERKQSEEVLAKALIEAKNANEVKDQFIANISHEIRTPLNSILGFSNLFKHRYSDEILEKDRVIFEYIKDSSERLMHTVDSILNMSMLNAGTVSIHREVVNLNQMANITASNYKVQADKKHLSIELIQAGGLTQVFVDKNCIGSALDNLTDNAVKYTEAGSIQLKLAVIEDQVTLSISDTGIGISDEYKERLFEPFTQESKGFTKDFQGVGLGLAITKRFLDLNDVELELESEKNVGSTFTLRFPKYEAEENE